MMRLIGRKSNIPAYAVQESYERLTELFGDGKVVIIGGRAVNIYCFNNKRDTHDIDVVLGKDPNKIDDFFNKAVDMGFIPIRAQGKISGVTDNETGATVDFFYKDSMGGKMNGSTITIPIADILSTAAERSMSRDETVRTVNPALLVLMKYAAGRGKDWEDIRNIVTNQYRTTSEFLRQEKGTILKYIPDRESVETFVKEINKAVKTPQGMRDVMRR